MPRHKRGERNPSDPLPFWSGTITFGLVSVPVDLYSAVHTRRVPSRMFGPDGEPLSRRYLSEDGQVLTNSKIVRGWDTGDGRFIEVTDEELEKLEPRKSRDIDLRRFVQRDEIPLAMLDRHYILAPGGESTKAYHLLAQAMERDDRAGIATYVMRGREYLIAIYARGGLLFGATLRFADELRSPETIGLPPVEQAAATDVKAMKAALRKLAAKSLDPKLFVDKESDALLKLAERKHAKGQDVIEAGEPDDYETERAEIIDIMSILKQRMQDSKSPKDEPATSDDEDQSMDELYDRAKELNIKGRSKMTRAELERAIRKAG